jgi:hypothetical protein
MTTAGNAQDRRVETSFVTEVSPEPFQLSFERAPVWLLALEPSMCPGVYFKDVGSPHALLKLLNERGHDPTLFNRAVTRLGLGRVHFGKTPKATEVTSLVSGSYPFLQQAGRLKT